MQQIIFSDINTTVQRDILPPVLGLRNSQLKSPKDTNIFPTIKCDKAYIMEEVIEYVRSL